MPSTHRLPKALYWPLPAALVGALVVYALPPYNIKIIQVCATLLLLYSIHKLPAKSLFITALCFGCGMFFHAMAWLYALVESEAIVKQVVLNLAHTGTLLLQACLAIAIPAYVCQACYARRFPLYLTVAPVFTLFEWLRSFAFTGLTYLQPGYLLIDTPFESLAPIGGVLLLTFVYYAMLSLVVSVALAPTRFIKPSVIVAGLLGVLVLVSQQITWTTPGKQLNVRLMHDSMSTAAKSQYVSAQQRLKRLLANTYTAQGVDLVIWPEGSIRPNLGLYRKLYDHRGSLSQLPATVLVGGYSQLAGQAQNQLIQAAKLKPVYDKSHLIPFGEYTPQWLQQLLALMGFATDEQTSASHLSTNEINNVAGIVVNNANLQAAICFEILFGDDLRRAAQDYAAYVHISDLSWFVDNHVAGYLQLVARMRALELSKPFLRATNLGVTSAIDHHGRVVATHKANTDYLDVRVTGQLGQTAYAQWGDRPLVVSASIWLIAIFWYRRRHNRYSQVISRPSLSLPIRRHLP